MTRSAFAKTIKSSYIGLNLLFTFTLLLLCVWGDKIIYIFSKFVDCPADKEGDLSICLGISLIVRISFALLIFHLILTVLLFTRDSFAKFVNEQCFGLKALIIVLITIALLFIHNSKLLLYVRFSSYVSFVFLIYQSIILIDFGYTWNETWV